MFDEKMTLSDLMKVSSIFTAINAVEPFPFIAANGAENLDLALTDLYGERELFNSVKYKTIEQNAKLIVMLHKPKWLGLVNMAVDEWEIGSTGTRKITESIVENETRTLNRDDVNKVAVFDSDVLADKDGYTTTGNDGLDNTKTRTLTDSQNLLSQAFSDLRTLEKNAIINVVLRDVAIFLTLSIY